MADTLNEGRVERLARVRLMAASGLATRIRKVAQLSRAEMARELGISDVTLARWERAEVRPKAPGALDWLDLLERLRGSGSAGASTFDLELADTDRLARYIVENIPGHEGCVTVDCVIQLLDRAYGNGQESEHTQ